MARHKPKWRDNGVRIVHGNQLDLNTPQTPGMTRAAAINRAMAGANKLWAGSVEIHPNAKTAPHHHGELESIIYVISGRARMRWGEKLEFVADAGPGDFSSCRRSFRIKRSTRCPTNLSCASWSAAIRSRL